MKYVFFLLFIILFPSFCFAEDYVCPDASYRRSLGFQPSGCSVVPEIQIPGQRDIDEKVPQKYRKIVNGLLVEMTAQEKSDFDATEAANNAAALISSSNSSAKNSVDEISPEGVRLRAALLVTLDEINALRDWITAFKAQVALASSLADLKTRVAGLPSTPDRTASQVKTAIKGKIDDGSAD